jgi:hypothetical protein
MGGRRRHADHCRHDRPPAPLTAGRSRTPWLRLCGKPTRGRTSWFRRTSTEFALWPGDGRLQSVKQAALTPTAFPKISTISIRKKKAYAFETGRILHAVRTSDLLRFGGRSPYVGSTDTRQEFQHDTAHGKSNRSARVLLPCLPTGGRRIVDATILSGDGLQDAGPVALRCKGCGRRNAVSRRQRRSQRLTPHAPDQPVLSMRTIFMSPLLSGTRGNPARHYQDEPQDAAV